MLVNSPVPSLATVRPFGIFTIFGLTGSGDLFLSFSGGFGCSVLVGGFFSSDACWLFDPADCCPPESSGARHQFDNTPTRRTANSARTAPPPTSSGARLRKRRGPIVVPI